MVEIKENLIKHLSEENVIAWLMGLSVINLSLNESLIARKEKLFQLNDNPIFKNISASVLNELAEKLVNKQQKIVPELAAISEKHDHVSDLYMRYDQLKQEREQLLNQLAAEKHDFKDQMAVEINRMR
ncbi:MAG: hypothetical protein ACI8ZM_002514 [Crocinitomix sp.]|jgi:hypothetical protein